MILTPAHQRIAECAFFTFLLLASNSCKPAPRSDPDENTQTADEKASRQPNAADFKTFFQTLLPSTVTVSDLKADPPVRMPNMPPNSNAWFFNVKITLTPIEDLLAVQSPEDARTMDGLLSELNTLIAWRNAYVRSPYARVYGAFDVIPPAASTPQLLVVQQPKNKPLAPIYGKVAAEWQVDHWQFSNMDLDLPAMGQIRSLFTGPTMVVGSPEANAFVAAEQKAVADGKQKQTAIEERYAKDLIAATKPGTTYRGQISHPRGNAPCEVRFLDISGTEPQTVTFEIRIPQEPTYQYIYTAKLSSQVPLNITADASISQPIRVSSGSSDTDVPVGNLAVNYLRGTGKKSLFGSLPSVMLNGAGGMGNDKPFLLLDGHLKGVVSSFNGDFVLIAELIK